VNRYRQELQEGVESMWANGKEGRILTLAVGNNGGSVPAWATTGRNKLGEESSPH